MNMKININILTSRRCHYLELIFHFINKIKPENKNKINLNILATPGLESFVHKMLQSLDGINYNVISNYDNYLDKIQWCVNQDCVYSMKHDEDIFMSNHLYDYIIENVHLLDDENNLLLTPLISNGIPTTDTFIQTFFESEHQVEFNNYFKNTTFFPLWGADYTFLNQETIHASEFKSSSFYNAVSNYNHHYKGIHPVRINNDAQLRMLNLLLMDKYIIKFNQKNDFNIINIEAPYLCNNIFTMKTNKWKEIVNNQSLFYDAFDEVPISIYKQINNKKFLFINNGFAIHTLYNTISSPENDQNEQLFYQNLKTKIYENNIT